MLGYHERESGELGAQQLLEPPLIQQHLLVRSAPEGSDLLFLAPGCKGLLSDGKRQLRFEVFGLGIRIASLLSADRFAGDAQQFGQACLRQPDGSAQAQHGLTKGIVSLTVGEPLHERAPFCVTHRSAHGT